MLWVAVEKSAMFFCCKVMCGCQTKKMDNSGIILHILLPSVKLQIWILIFIRRCCRVGTGFKVMPLHKWKHCENNDCRLITATKKLENIFRKNCEKFVKALDFSWKVILCFENQFMFESNHWQGIASAITYILFRVCFLCPNVQQ